MSRNFVRHKVRPGTKLKVRQVSDEKTTNTVRLRVPRGMRVKVRRV